MKKIIYIVIPLCFLFSVDRTYAQPQTLWRQTFGPEGGSVYDLAVDSLQTVYAATVSGIYRREGNIWRAINSGLHQLPVRQIQCGPILTDSSGAIKSYIYALSNNEVMRFFIFPYNYPSEWEYLDLGIGTPLTVQQIMTNAKGYLFVAAYNFGVLRSKDNGKTFDRPSDPMKDSTIVKMTVDRKQNLYAMTKWGNIFRSVNDGDSWSPVGTTPPKGGY
jgi:ligand-binding sensor domain-containing protein